MLKNPSSYQSISPKKLNREHEIIIDKYTGREAVRHRLDELGIKYNEPLLNCVLSQIKKSPLVTNWTNKKIIQLVKHMKSSRIEKSSTTF